MTDFPGVPGTATIEHLLARDDREDIKARGTFGNEAKRFDLWRYWDERAIVYVLAPPPRTITLPSNLTAEWVGNGYRLKITSGDRFSMIHVGHANIDTIAAWVDAWRTWEADNA